MKRTTLIWLFGLIFQFAIFESNKAESLILRLFDVRHTLLAEASTPLKSGKANITVKMEREFQDGDYWQITGSAYLHVDLCDSIHAGYLYAPQKDFLFKIPLNERGRTLPVTAFSGISHIIKIRSCAKNEWKVSRNIALNPFDNNVVYHCYPHATSNSEYGKMSVFAARNVIDGCTVNHNHGKWPFQSWGPYKSDSVWLKIDFGKMVEVDKIVIVNRAQFADNHDSSWKNATLNYSDGTTEKITLSKTYLPQVIKVKRHKTSYIKFSDLKPYEDKWCSWTEVEVWGIY